MAFPRNPPKHLVLPESSGYNDRDMIPDPTPQRRKTAGLPQYLIFCLLLSFLLHLLLIWLLPRFAAEPEPPAPQPTYVTLEEYPPRPQSAPQKLELDEPPRPDQEAPEQADRLAETNRKVETEMAPRGEDTRDRPALQAPAETAPAAAVPPSPPDGPSRRTEKKPAATAPHKPRETGLLPPEPAGEEQPALPGSSPSLADLTRPTPDTLQRMARTEQRGRIKNREELLEGDAVYLNLQQDYLLSFFKRFSNRIEAAWNYPVEAARRSEQGTLLLKITVTRQGQLLDVDLLDSSGSDALDYEAIQAVYRAAPFGPVTSHWPHEQMKIYAHFQYTLSNRYIFGR
jgi:protein TonB